MLTIIEIEKNNLKGKVNLDNGQLISLTHKGVEYFHNGGQTNYNGKGWSNSEITPFPIFGPANNQKVNVNNQTFFLEQHGISRHAKENPFQIKKQEKNTTTLIQKYKGQNINNPKYSEQNKKPRFLNWLPYTLEKQFTLTDKELICTLTLTNTTSSEMPYMIGWHPAFKIQGAIKDGEFVNDKGMCVATLDEVIKFSNIPPEEALTLKNINSISYRNKISGKGIKVSSNDFSNNVMLWSPNKNSGMIAIEHSSQLPIHNNQNYFSDKNKFETLKSGQSKTYSIQVQPLL